MVSPSAGSVVLVRFPFSDLSASKLRPAIVLAAAGRDDWILCQVTSNPYGDPNAVRIDVQTSTPGLGFAEAWKRKTTMEYNGQKLHVVCRQDLISSKRAAGREVDLEDVRLLELSDSDDTESGHPNDG